MELRQVHTTPTVRMMVFSGADTAKSDVVIRTYKHNCNTHRHTMNDVMVARAFSLQYRVRG